MPSSTNQFCSILFRIFGSEFSPLNKTFWLKCGFPVQISRLVCFNIYIRKLWWNRWTIDLLINLFFFNFFCWHFAHSFPFGINNKVASTSIKATTWKLLVLLLLIFTPAAVWNQWASNIEPSNNPNDWKGKGTLFSEQSKNLLKEIINRV